MELLRSGNSKNEHWFFDESWSPYVDGWQMPPIPGGARVGIIADLWNPKAPGWVAESVITSAADNPQHVFIATTAHVDRLRTFMQLRQGVTGNNFAPAFKPPSNFWVMVSVENLDQLRHAAAVLSETPLAVAGIRVYLWNETDTTTALRVYWAVASAKIAPGLLVIDPGPVSDAAAAIRDGFKGCCVPVWPEWPAGFAPLVREETELEVGEDDGFSML